MMTYYDHFVIPFLVGTVFMFAVILWKWGRWLWLLPVTTNGLSAGEYLRLQLYAPSGKSFANRCCTGRYSG